MAKCKALTRSAVKGLVVILQPLFRSLCCHSVTVWWVFCHQPCDWLGKLGFCIYQANGW